MKIITLPDAAFKLWKSFLKLQSEGGLIDPLTMRPYNEGDKFNLSSCILKKEFFKHLGHFNDVDLEAYVKHLLLKTAERNEKYPKLSIPKTKILVPRNMLAADWVERRKQKKVVLEEMKEANARFLVCDDSGNVVDKEWR